jgi:hypothetical protein
VNSSGVRRLEFHGLGPVLTLGILVFVLLPMSVSAQVDLSAHIGRIGSNRVLFEEYDVPSSVGISVPEMSHRSAAILGGSLTFWPRRYIGLELNVSYAAGGVEFADEAINRVGGQLSILVATVRVLPSIQVGDRLSLNAVLGTGLVDREAFEIAANVPGSSTEFRFERITTPAWTLGAGARLRTGSRIHFRLGVERLVSSPSYSGVFERLSPVQHDLVLALGLSVRL